MDKGPLLDVWRRYKSNPSEVDARNMLIEHYMPIVRYHASQLHRRMSRRVELGDVVAAGVFGLIEAMEAFDLDRGLSFKTFCKLRVRGSILDAQRRWDVVPRSQRRLAARLDRESQRLAHSLGRPPSDDELAEVVGMSVERLVRTRARIDVRDPELRSRLESDLVCERNRDPRAPDPTRRVQQMDLVREATRGMRKQERLVVLMYYCEGMTQREVGESLGITEGRVSQVLASVRERWRRAREHDAHQREG